MALQQWAPARAASLDQAQLQAQLQEVDAASARAGDQPQRALRHLQASCRELRRLPNLSTFQI
jgi:hypothetical protein